MLSVRKLFNIKLLFGLATCLVIAASVYSFFTLNTIFFQDKQIKEEATKDVKKEVLGRYTSSPQIYIYGGDQKFSSGGLITLASTDEPAIQIGGYKISGDAQISMYEATEELLLNYLTHDEEGKQIKEAPDVKNLKFVKAINTKIDTQTYSGSKVTLPLRETGIWYLKVKVAGVDANAFILRSNFGVIAEEGNNEFIFWGQNFKTKRSLTEGSVKIMNLQGGVKELQLVSFNSEGIARGTMTESADIALVYNGLDKAIIPINLKYLNTGYSNYKSFFPKTRLTKYFIFTDRPLYGPGDSVYFKAVLRDDDDARYTVAGGEASVKIYSGYYYEGSTEVKPIFEQGFAISTEGSINGQFKLPTDAKVGYYTLAVTLPDQAKSASNNNWGEWSSNTTSFEVQYFQKPEFSIDVTTSKSELVAGDKSTFKITGSYFSGQPLIRQRIKYTVYASDFYEYQNLEDRKYLENSLNNNYRYGYGYGETVKSGVIDLDEHGEAVVELDTSMDFNEGKTQVYSIEATIVDGSQTPAFARRNMLVYSGEYGIYRKDSVYGSKVNVPVSIPTTIVPYDSKTNVGGVNLSAKIKRSTWVSYQEKDKKYPSYREETENLNPVSVTTNNRGDAVVSFTPRRTGSYTITVEGKDQRGNLISKLFYTYISSEGEPYFDANGTNELTISPDKQKYQPTDTIRFNIYSSIPNRDVFLSMQRGRVDRFQVVRLNGNSGTVDVPLTETDIPNIHASVSSFSNYLLNNASKNVSVSADSKRLIVEVSPNNKKYGPGDTVTIDVSTKDLSGNPVSAELALWTVDKAIFELSDTKLGNIFEVFWDERGNTTQQANSLEGILVNQAEGGGGCFAEGTKVLMHDGKSKNIEEVKEGEYVLTRTENDDSLVKSRVTKTHMAEVSGYIILNGNLRVTPNHILRVNGIWKQAGSIQSGDYLINNEGEGVTINSIEWQAGKFNVYNLTIEKYHTYFAGGYWVHNEKGLDRKAFKDTAYWNPTLHTDSTGKAQVTFTLPDNLTTWAIAAVGATSDTRVGQTTSEILVTKDIIVRPILPNILRVGDEIILSALVQNFSDVKQELSVDIKFDSGQVGDNYVQKVALDPSTMEQLYWKVKPNKENEKAKIVFGARSVQDSKIGDVVTQEIPVRIFGFTEKSSQTGIDSKAFSLNLSPDSHKDKSSITLDLSPTILGTLPISMTYLLDYPYGCVEQTTSRFVPAVIAKLNPNLFSDALKDKNVNDLIVKGVSRLSSLQLNDGGWTWWYSGNSDPYITAYVVEYLVQARNAGIKVDEEMLENAKTYLETQGKYDGKTGSIIEDKREDIISKNYGLTLLGAKEKIRKVNNLENLSPDLLSIAVMTNYLNGDQNSKTNGLDKLVSIAQKAGDGVYWGSGDQFNFGSSDASTALAIRAILIAKGDRNLAAKAASHLMKTRKYEYWSNTYATSQIIRALTELSKTGSELSPNYSYEVVVNGNRQIQGAVSNSNQAIDRIEIPYKDMKSANSTVSVKKNGSGQMYSTLLVSEYRTDKNVKEKSNGISISRKYVNEKGPQYTLAVGDTARVELTVSGLSKSQYYGVIQDELPSGMVPINESFKNEQYGKSNDIDYVHGISGREVTENGIILSLYQVGTTDYTYRYRARVVNEGTFSVPPATVSLMYSPEINGRTGAETITITKESKIIPSNLPESFDQKTNSILVIGGIVFILGGTIFLLRRRGIYHDDIVNKIKEVIPKRKDDTSQ